jgi:hypothetical protein
LFFLGAWHQLVAVGSDAGEALRVPSKRSALVPGTNDFSGNAAAIWQWGHQDPTRQLAGYILVGLLFMNLIVWLFVVTEAFVEDASLAYTERLLEACDTLAKRKSGKAS